MAVEAEDQAARVEVMVVRQVQLVLVEEGEEFWTVALEELEGVAVVAVVMELTQGMEEPGALVVVVVAVVAIFLLV